MFNKGKLFAALLFSVSSCAVALAQQTTPAPAPPVSVQPFTQVFMSDGGGYLGIQTDEVNKENFSKLGLREVRGVLVEKVTENSPASQAGLQSNDVIVRFNGEEVTSTRKLSRMISEVAPDHQAKLTVVRGGSEREITATLGKRPGVSFTEGGSWTMSTIPAVPMPNAMPMPRVMPMPNMPNMQAIPRGTFTPGAGEGGVFTFSNSSRQIGVSVTALNKQLGDYFGVADGKGVLINNVNENSPAAKAGLKAGDVIVEADGKAVNNSSELMRAISEKKEGDVNLTIMRNKNRQTVRVTPEKREGGTFEIYTDENGTNVQPGRTFRITRPMTNATPITPTITRRATRTM